MRRVQRSASQIDLSHTATDVDAHRHRGADAIGVHPYAVTLFEPFDGDVANPLCGGRGDGDVFWQVHSRFPDTAAHLYGVVALRFAAQVYSHLTGADIQIDSTQVQLAKLQGCLTCPDVRHDVQRHRPVEVHSPDVDGIPEARGITWLRKGQLAAARLVLDERFPLRHVVRKIPVH